jgi:putative FmdB family regulatory protein
LIGQQADAARTIVSRRNATMPVYEYYCDTCAKSFTVVMTIAEHDRGGITCPECKGSAVVQRYTPFFAKTSKKS